MESWARADPADLPTRLEEVEIIFERLDLIALFELLLAKCSVHDRKALSYVGGIRLSSDDIGFPAPYASTEHYMLADGGKMMTRDPGDALWANVFDVLSRQHMMRHKREESLHLENLSMDRKGDMLEPLPSASSTWTVLPHSYRHGSCSAAFIARGYSSKTSRAELALLKLCKLITIRFIDC